MEQSLKTLQDTSVIIARAAGGPNIAMCYILDRWTGNAAATADPPILRKA